jgi:hypothetical protein
MKASPTRRLVIDDDMTIYQAQAQKEQLLAALAATPTTSNSISPASAKWTPPACNC